MALMLDFGHLSRKRGDSRDLNKRLVMSVSGLFVLSMLLGSIPSVFASTWTATAPYSDCYFTAWRGSYWPERAWEANAFADEHTGNMQAFIRSWMDVAGYLNVHFETAVGDMVYVTDDGYLDIGAVVSLQGLAHVFGICATVGGYSAGWSLDLFLVVDDMTTGGNVLNWRASSWEDSASGVVGSWVDRETYFDWDCVIPQTPVPVVHGHAYRVRVKLAGWAGTTVFGIAAAQANIGFLYETDPFRMQLERLIYDGPGMSGRPPLTPAAPYGTEEGVRNKVYAYSASTTDPDGDYLTYQFDWDDGTVYTLGPFASGVTVITYYSWSDSGKYHVKVRATDSYYGWTDWSPAFTVTINAGVRK